MKRWTVGLLLALVIGWLIPDAMTTFNGAAAQGTSDPCQSASTAKSSTKIAVAAASTAQLVALAAGQTVYVCHADAVATGTSPTIQFEYGTGTTCATGTTTVTGAYAPTAATTEVSLGYGGTVFATAPGNALCIVVGGTGPSVQGVLTYVQQ